MRRWNWAAASAGATFVLTLVTFVVAVTTLPLSGPFCVADCFNYPYHEAVTRFPRDYYWMGLACLLYLAFVVLLTRILDKAPVDRRVPAILALTFGAMSATVLISDYVMQLSVIQSSLLNGETEGIALLSQFNPHGVFIALEELGYVLMALAMAFAAAALEGDRPSYRIARASLHAALPSESCGARCHFHCFRHPSRIPIRGCGDFDYLALDASCVRRASVRFPGTRAGSRPLKPLMS